MGLAMMPRSNCQSYKNLVTGCSLSRLLITMGYLGLLLFVIIPSASGQDIGSDPGSLLVIGSTDAGSAPTLVLRAYGLDGQGNPLNISPNTVTVNHGGAAVNDVELAGTYMAGTFTIFLVDIPPGVDAQIDGIQQAIGQYASPPNMEERVDFISVYRVGETEATELLTPTNFYNATRNFLAAPLEPQAGPTALLDSLGRLLDQAESLKPKADVYASIVVFTDGTDVVSTTFDAEALGQRAAELGVPIHTIWLENESLQPFSQVAGRDYLSQLAAESRGLAARLDQPAEVEAIWGRISAFRAQTVLHYRPEGLTGGSFDVEISLRDDPAVRAGTRITVAAGAPIIQLNIPAESRSLKLESLDEPVELSFSAAVTWLDEVERELVSAELMVNGVPVQEIDVRDVDRFTVVISNFNYGPNTIQLAVEDELGQQATSPEIILSVLQGETEVPEEIQPESPLGQGLLRAALTCLVILLVLGALVLLVLVFRRRNLLSRLGGGRKGRSARRPMKSRPLAPEPFLDETATTSGAPYLEILRSVTRMPLMIDLTAVEYHIGRSPMQADIVFENDITVAPRHATIALEGSDYRLYDAGTANPTLVNGQKVPEYGRQLIDGDEIRLGDVRMVYHLG